MAKFTDYTQKTKPADADLLLIHDNAGAANKKTPFSGVWSWILDKLASAVISQLETTNKSIIPAINELNSKTARIYGHDRLSSSDDLIETVKTYASGIHIFYTNSQTGSRPNASEDGSAMVIACVLTQETDILLIAKKIDKMYQTRISGGAFLGWEEV